MEKVRTAAIGLGSRGSFILTELLLRMDNVELTAVCDVYPDRAEAAADAVEKASGRRPFVSTDSSETLDRPDVEAALVMSAWESHVPIALEAMEKGVPVGIEVGGAYSVQDSVDLVRAYERTGTPFMLLENCCYGELEMMVMNMVEQGLFGEIVHCEGGYRHDLRAEIAFGKEHRHYRLRNYLSRNCENYPTHELGPIAQILRVNRGNRMVSLVSVASKAVGLNDYAARTGEVDRSLADARFAQGDVVTTLIRCANGETITLTLDTTLPRPYTRGFTVQGTRGMYCEDNNSVYLDRDFTEADHFNWTPQWNNAARYLETYRHPVWERYRREGVRGGHGGMDGLVYNEFIECVRTGRPCPIDVYDAAAWMAVTPLSERSIALGGTSVEFPDFTDGRWRERKP